MLTRNQLCYPLKTFILLIIILLQSNTGVSQLSFTSDDFIIELNQQGYFTSWKNTRTKKNYIYTDTLAPLITLISNQTRITPSSLKYDKKNQTITLGFKQSMVKLDIKVISKPTHLVFEIIKAEPENKTEAIVWGPYPTTINKTIGEVIGVVRDGEIAIGMQVLNIKTLGGDLPNDEGSTWERGLAAKKFKGGSSIQAYSINRNRPRLVNAWGGQFKHMPVPALKGETVVGSKIALFSCIESATLDRLEQIEIDEHLPHPTIKGVWFKKSVQFGKSYLISSFGEKDVDEMIAYTKQAGLISLYHEGPFKSWGHFILNDKHFPSGRAGLKASADKAHAAGLMFGIHTLTNFINTNDPYVTPVPDDRLSATGSSTLIKDIDEHQQTIEVASPVYFNEENNNNLHTVKIGKELIRYKSVTMHPPFLLIDCQRAAFGTTASSHPRGDIISKLFDHAYQVFFPNLEMQREVAKNLADLLNETGVDHLDFDGHEGGLASGEGDFAVELFAKDVYDQVKHEFICGTSISKTFYWHLGSYYNWGEPWYGGFKESMQQYRIDNQGLFDRNYMPHMLGWYLLGEHTTLAEMEWMLARAAGYQAGFAMVARPNALRNNSRTPVLLDAIREWELARNTYAFSDAQKELLKNPVKEFHLEKKSEGVWNLHQYAISELFPIEKPERQPGEPTYITLNWKQEWQTQPIQFRINIPVKSPSVNSIKIQIDNYVDILLPVELKAGESLVCDGTEIIRLYDIDGKPKGNSSFKITPPIVSPGQHSIRIDYSSEGDDVGKIELQFKGMGKMEEVKSRK